MLKYEKIFIDSNIIIDFLAEKRFSHKEAVELFANQKENEIYCFSFGSVSDITYVLQRAYGFKSSKIISFFDNLSIDSKYWCLSLSDSYLEEACKYSLDLIDKNKSIDFEDALQYFCALENGCDVIITNDKNFPKLDIPLIRTNPSIENYYLEKH